MNTPQRGIRRARWAAGALAASAIAAVGVTSGLAYADTRVDLHLDHDDLDAHHLDGHDLSTGSTTATTDATGSDSTGADSSGSTSYGTAPTVTAGSGDTHSQTSGS